ncbi:SDR family oxidoreductase [Allosphingosinicella sp.]|uniref:SDR family oxidoreductase n=1 Tax=Allosphingosinicella sp. TaxID=2823234 RepID=UPI002FC252A6
MFRVDLLQNKRILVTGGGTGIGNAMATRFAQLGARVYIASRRRSMIEESARQMAEATGAEVTGLVVDVRHPDQVEALIEMIWDDGGPLTGLVNSAAGNFIARTEDVSVNGFHALTDIQFRGPFYVTTACGRRWIREGIKANVVSVVDAGVWGGDPFAVPATMAKAGLENMTKSLAIEWARYGIRLNAVASGVFRTEGSATRLDPLTERGWNGANNPMGRIGELEEMGNLGAFLMADGVDFLTGQTVAIDGGAFIATGATFTSLLALDDADWAAIKHSSRAATDAQKTQRA